MITTETGQIFAQLAECTMMELASARSSMALAKKYSIDDFEKKMIAWNIACLDRAIVYLIEGMDVIKEHTEALDEDGNKLPGEGE